MATIITWRESNRKRASQYAALPQGVTRDDYSFDLDSVPRASVITLAEMGYGHLLNNEAISAVIRNADKAKSEGNADFDAIAWIHDYRMNKCRAEVLNGTLRTTRTRSAPVVVDPVTLKMQAKMHATLLAIATTKAPDKEFPKEFNAKTAQIIVQPKSGTTLGQMVASMIAADNGEVRNWAIAEVEKEKAALAAAPSVASAIAESFFEDEDEEDEAAE